MHIGGHFNLVNRVILNVNCFIIHVIISSRVMYTFNLTFEAKISKSSN